MDNLCSYIYIQTAKFLQRPIVYFIMENIFDSTENWSFSEKQAKANARFSQLQQSTIDSLPEQMYTEKSIILFDELKQLHLYKVLKTLPKGVLHHLHFDCTQDEEYYAQHVVTDPIVYLNKEQNQFRIGTKEQAQKDGWVTMGEVRKQFDTQEKFIKKISNLTMLNKAEMKGFSELQADRWKLFEKKIQNFFPILGTEHLWKKYAIHALRKYVKNGYDRIEFRAMLTKLTQYDQHGNVVTEHSEKRFMDVFDEAYKIVKQEHPPLTVGFIFFGLKMLPAEQNEKILTTALELRWDKTIGIDFVQQQDPYGDQAPYDIVADKVLEKFPDLDIKKVYHVGQTKDHQNNNIQIAIKAGTARIGHGINVFQHPHLLNVCKAKKICFQKCPVSNILLTYCKDPRQGTSALVQGLGIPVTINPDDPGKFGLEDSTMDYFFATVSYNWALKNLKLLGIHSINHSINSKQAKGQLIKVFNERWNKWIDQFLAENNK